VLLAGGIALEAVTIGAGKDLGAVGAFIPYMGYYVAGYWLREVQRVYRLWPLFVGCAVFAALLMTWGTYVIMRSPEGGPWARYWLTYLSPAVVVEAICVFIAFQGIARIGSSRRKNADVNVRGTGGVTMGIYLVHPLVLALTRRAGISVSQWPVGVSVLGIACLVCATSWVMSAWIVRWKMGRLVVGL
jgi:surface polysaccharide O-acyltransferase-like enzyme